VSAWSGPTTLSGSYGSAKTDYRPASRHPELTGVPTSQLYERAANDLAEGIARSVADGRHTSHPFPRRTQ
jgi:hypothetical protein